ncbi:hypothetical protein BKA67DRAFT_419634 [Truncatella angustata]|uniref:Uncharacterized protein n=1 Tax=Truncatella angustata TaxID=152316 RepID=A0A9P8UD05_9PEZI|nr:uncharacterized protein BKA67DRAFT_419634 [Truncatella angustata]KAH6646925.1 hypothetical protein BKA67DRAFT_419634 [Truncatella angustata]
MPSLVEQHHVLLELKPLGLSLAIEYNILRFPLHVGSTNFVPMRTSNHNPTLARLEAPLDSAAHAHRTRDRSHRCTDHRWSYCSSADASRRCRPVLRICQSFVFLFSANNDCKYSPPFPLPELSQLPLMPQYLFLISHEIKRKEEKQVPVHATAIYPWVRPSFLLRSDGAWPGGGGSKKQLPYQRSHGRFCRRSEVWLDLITRN